MNRVKFPAFVAAIVLLGGLFGIACAQAAATAAPASPAWANTIFAAVGGVLAVGSALGFKNASFLGRAAKEVQNSHDAINAIMLFVQHNRAIIATAGWQEIADFNAIVNSVSSILIDTGSASLITKGKALQALEIAIDGKIQKLAKLPPPAAPAAPDPAAAPAAAPGAQA
jgi:hypothetical protein